MHAPSKHRRRRTPSGARRLILEPLEDRRLLAAASAAGLGGALGGAADADDGAPWQNPVLPFDVNNDSRTTASDVLAVINRVLIDGIGDLPEPDPDPPELFIDTSGDNRLSALDVLLVINGILTPPEVAISPLTSFTADLTPQLTVTVGGAVDVPDGTAVELDVDLNGNGDFNDPGELGHTQSTLTNRSSSFDIAPALAQSDEPYSINLRARVKNVNAVEGSSPRAALLIDTSTSTVLADYVNDPDPAYEYQLAEGSGITNPIPGATAAGSFMYYVLDMTSQTWRSGADVDSPQWEHWIEVYVPVEVSGEVVPDLDNTAVLVVDGGNSAGAVPQSPSPALGLAATASKAIVANVMIVPNQPVTFTDEVSPRSGDGIVAYTFDKFMDNLGQPGNETWPVLLPMVKSVARAMDSVQDFIPTLKPEAQIDDFVVIGDGNRAWATWLSAAVDDRVAAIMPVVFENLNLPTQMSHHFGVYGFFSNALADYDDLNVYQRIQTPAGAALTQIVDPYQYLTNGRFDSMPKLLINTPGDEFFATDSAQYYFGDIPGDQNYLRYIPNTSHALEFVDQEVAESGLSFLDAVLHDRPLPEFSWTVDPDETIRVQTVTPPSKVTLWQMNNVNTRDFRRLRFPRVFWFSRDLVDQGGGNYVTDVELPASGARAYFVELTFPNPVPGLPDFVFTTEVRVKSTLPLNPWPFDTAAPADFDNAIAGFPASPDTPSATPAGPAALRDAVAVTLARQSAQAKGSADAVPAVELIAVAEAPVVEVVPHHRPLLEPAEPEPNAPAGDEADSKPPVEAIDSAFADLFE